MVGDRFDPAQLDPESRKALDYRRKHRGVIGIRPKVPLVDASVLSLVYTPGVAEPCRAIAENPADSFRYTCRGNTVAVVTDGSRVLQMGRAGPLAALPNLEGKSALFKTFAGVDAFPICLNTLDENQIINTVMRLAPTFGGICLMDITSPRCFLVEQCLSRAMNIPVFHDDQHATAIEVYAGLKNAARLIGKRLEDLAVVILGAGAAGLALADFFLRTGVGQKGEILLCDSRGLLHKYRLSGMNWAKFAMAKQTNLKSKRGSLAEALARADVVIGVSASQGAILDAEMVSRMNRDAIVFALSVPDPEILPAAAKAGGARIVATGRGDYPNEINTAMVFPGVFRGALDAAARAINFEMCLAAAEALADLVSEDELNEDHIVPNIFDFRIAPALAAAVARAAVHSGVARIPVDPEEVRARLEHFIYEGEFPTPPKAKKYADLKSEALALHERYQGMIEVCVKVPIRDPYMLKLLYLPPMTALPAREIAANPDRVYDLTCKNNLVAVVSDGSAVLGLGNIGPRAGLPVMEGKCVLFHTFGGVEAFPICIATQDVDEIVELVQAIAPGFGGINLEDISAPRCFAVEERLKQSLDIPVFHDDQHGTAVVVLAGLLNALKLVGKEIGRIQVVINGAGAAAVAVAKILLQAGVRELVLCDTRGAIYAGREEGMNWAKEKIAKVTNLKGIRGNLKQAVQGADVLLGLSVAEAFTPEMIQSMARDPVVFALANPVPEIMPEAAKAAGARVVATGRSDFENQINNCLGFPGIFRGALDVRATAITDEMKLAAAQALAELVGEPELKAGRIIPATLNLKVYPRVAAAVARAAIQNQVARKPIDPEGIAQCLADFLYEGKLA